MTEREGLFDWPPREPDARDRAIEAVAAQAPSRPDPAVTAVILAAGASTRLGRPKQLLLLDDKPVIWHVASRAIASGVDDVLVVTGAAHEQVAAAVHGLDVRLVRNPQAHLGQSTSLRAGMMAMRSATGVILLLGDQPEVESTVIASLAEMHRRERDAIAQAAYRGWPSHPILFPDRFFIELLAVTGDEGARSIVRRHRDRVRLLPIGRDAPGDIDTEADYEALTTRWERRSEREDAIGEDAGAGERIEADASDAPRASNDGE